MLLTSCGSCSVGDASFGYGDFPSLSVDETLTLVAGIGLVSPLLGHGCFALAVGLLTAKLNCSSHFDCFEPVSAQVYSSSLNLRAVC